MSDQIVIPILSKKMVPEVVQAIQQTLDAIFDAFTSPSQFRLKEGLPLDERKLYLFDDDSNMLSIRRSVNEYTTSYLVRCGPDQYLSVNINRVGPSELLWSENFERRLPTDEELILATNVIASIVQFYAIKAWREDKIKGVVTRLKLIHDAVTGKTSVSVSKPFLTEGIYGLTDWKTRECPFGLRGGQKRNRPLVRTAGWFNGNAKWLGFGDLDAHDLYRIAAGIPEGEMFVVTDYVFARKFLEKRIMANACRYIVEKDHVYLVSTSPGSDIPVINTEGFVAISREQAFMKIMGRVV